ncbi:MAG: hypothetical protein KBC57_13600 [Neisseriaceae bacterium]|nr:hypothetical protein [Neisseriaceae bacterium]MBP6863377.1 hypothetical protein [Neisseriaceae bacterium]
MHEWAKLVPELSVSDVAASQRFWVGLIGFEVMYARPEEGFVYLNLAGAQVMLEAVQADQWLPAPLVRPFGNGLNLQIEVPALAPILARLAQDPDGYLLRLVEVLGNRPYVV